VKHCFDFVIIGLLTLSIPCFAEVITLDSGNQGEMPSVRPIAEKVRLGDRLKVRIAAASAFVNYPESPEATEMVHYSETSVRVSCPWYTKIDGSPLGEFVNQPFSFIIDHRVTCDAGDCRDSSGNAIPASELLRGVYNVPKCKLGNGNYGIANTTIVEHPATDCPKDTLCGPRVETTTTCCSDFAIEPVSGIETHYFEQRLILDSTREKAIEPSSVDLGKVYLVFSNGSEASTCSLADLLGHGKRLQVRSRGNCVLPPGDEFTVYAESRFHITETRPCGTFTTKGIKAGRTYAPDWSNAFYYCDGKLSSSPIERKYTYATRIDLEINRAGLWGR
jgi:hypothetical protein